MSKNIYSIVLNDEVVAKIDRLAYSMNTNRSNMINQILADHVSYITPEKRIKDVFDQIEQLLTAERDFQVLLQPSDSMFSLRSVLAYKYNPTVRYSVEMYRDERDNIGELRVSLRTTNSSLILYTTQFFKLWSKLEEKYIGGADYAIGDGRYSRKLKPRCQCTDAGGAIAAYINALDSAMKAFFASLDNPSLAMTAAERIFSDYCTSTTVLV